MVNIRYAVTAHLIRNIYHIDLFPESEEELRRAEKIQEEILEFVFLQGVMAAVESGIGKCRKEILKKYISKEQYALMKKVKGFFDKDEILNKGNIWDEDSGVY